MMHRGAMARAALAALLAAGGGTLSCRPTPAPEAPVRGLAIPVRDPTPRPPDDDDPRESPPDAEPARAGVMPAITREKVGGVELITAAQKGLPLCEVRVVVRGAGHDDEGAATGLAALTLRLAVEGGTAKISGRALAEQPGGPPSRAVLAGASVLRTAVTSERAADTVASLLSVLREPRLDGVDFGRVRRLEAARERAASTPAVAALLERELRSDARPATTPFDRLRVEDTRAFARSHYQPASLSVVAVGDVDPTALRAAIERLTRGWPPPGPPAAQPPASARPAASTPAVKVWVLDAPLAGVVELYAAAPGPDRVGDEWTATRLLAQVLGGSPGARLGAALAGGPGTSGARVDLVTSSAGSQILGQAVVEVTRTTTAMTALVDTLSKPPENLTEAELTGARRRATATFWRTLSAPAPLADELASLTARGAPDDTLQKQLDGLQSADAAAVQKAAQARLAGTIVAIAVGDAARVAPMLTRWGDVIVVDPVTLDRRRVVSP